MVLVFKLTSTIFCPIQFAFSQILEIFCVPISASIFAWSMSDLKQALYLNIMKQGMKVLIIVMVASLISIRHVYETELFYQGKCLLYSKFEFRSCAINKHKPASWTSGRFVKASIIELIDKTSSINLGVVDVSLQFHDMLSEMCFGCSNVYENSTFCFPLSHLLT